MPARIVATGRATDDISMLTTDVADLKRQLAG
jgi:hypothetical protein